MSVIWSGVTEEGAVVPVQVTAEGKVVAVGDGPEGDYLKLTGGNLTGDLTLDTDKITLNADGSGTLTGNLQIGGNPLDSAPNITLNADGSITAAGEVKLRDYDLSSDSVYGISLNGGSIRAQRPAGNNATAISVYQGTDAKIELNADGSIAAKGKLYTIGPDSSDMRIQVYDTSNNKTVAQINGNGSATFDAGVKANSFSSDRLDGIALLVSDGPGGTRTSALHTRDGFHVGGNLTNTNALNGNIILSTDGSTAFADGKCGFTSEGELFFTSRGTRYKIFVSQGLVQAEEYTRQMELKEKADQFVADKRETKPSQPGVTPDNDNA